MSAPFGFKRTSMLIISDTHNATPFPDGIPADFPHIDVLLHAGDLTLYGTRQEFRGVLDMLKTIPADVKLIIPGNHDLGLDKVWTSRSESALKAWEKCNSVKDGWKGKLGEDEWRRTENEWFSSSSRAVKEGVTMLREGKTTIKLKNGAQLKSRIYASPFTPEFYDWGFAYYWHQDRFNPKDFSLTNAQNIAQHPAYTSRADMRDVDVIMTHGPPFGRLDESKGSRDNCGCPHIMKAVQKCRPKIHCFGHIHEGYGAERINWSAVDRTAPDLDEPSDTRGYRQKWKNLSKTGAVTSIKPEIKTAAKLASAGLIDTTTRAVNETLIVNAALMDVKYRPVNRPWLVYVDLPVAV